MLIETTPVCVLRLIIELEINKIRREEDGLIIFFFIDDNLLYILLHLKYVGL